MCGIIGYAGSDNAAGKIYKGLLNLEYRGYDSAGLAILENGKCKVVKSCGRVEKLNSSLQFLHGNVGIGHTRWATHGKPSNANAHPHRYGKITVVHNGIIENYAELKSKLIAAGDIFSSDTDSEVVAHLIDRFYDGNLLSAVIKCADLLKGSYALLSMCDDKEEIVAAKFRSPVILGYGEGCNFCASDLPALAGNCRRVCVLEDGDFAVITRSEIMICDKSENGICRETITNPAQPAELTQGGFPHYMLKELWETPSTLKNTVTAFKECQSNIMPVIAGAERIILTGCGTAFHAALVGKRYIEEFCKIQCEAEYAGELRYKTPHINQNTVLVAVTQSGETADTVETARLYKSLGAKILSVTNSPHSAITRLSNAVVPVAAGVEVCVAATKSYSGQIAALYLLATLISQDSPEDNIANIERAPALILNTLQQIDIYALAEMCANSRGVYFLGRDIDYAVALEGSLKLKEVSYLAGGGYPASELKHGTLALIDEKTVSIFIITDETLAAKSSGAVEQVLARRGKAAVITNISSVRKEFKGRAEIISLPECDKFLSPLVSAAALQLLAYRTAVILGRDPDKPRNLAKSVTVE